MNPRTPTAIILTTLVSLGAWQLSAQSPAPGPARDAEGSRLGELIAIPAGRFLMSRATSSRG